jgi:hypothetical protein
MVIVFAVILAVMIGLVWGSLRSVSLESRRQISPSDVAWAAEYSSRKFLLLDRLLGGDDQNWLTLQERRLALRLAANGEQTPNLTPNLTRVQQSLVKNRKRFDLQRQQVVSRLLGDLEDDFSRIYSVAMYLLAIESEDRSALAMTLWRQRLWFSLTMSRVRFQLSLGHLSALFSPDASGARECLRNLVGSVQELHLASPDAR